MIFNPENIVVKEGEFRIGNLLLAKANACLDKDVFKDFWSGHSFDLSKLRLEHTDEIFFLTGTASPIPVGDALYTINVEPCGIRIDANTTEGLISGFLTLIDRIKVEPGEYRSSLKIDCCQIIGEEKIKNRMVHYCVFPETELWELKRFVRLSAALKYTHLVLEFWGMLKYDCLKELAWDHAFSKEDIRPIIEEAGELGLEIIPMFNHWGHATSSRVKHGKHVVLDQNPSLQELFSDDGWCWNLSNPKVRELHRNIRAELIDLCGNGKYFHVGCDEAYNFKFSEENVNGFCDYINEINSELKQSGRKMIMWPDMLIFKSAEFNSANSYVALAPDEKTANYMLSSLSKDIILADWQYWCKEYPVETSIALKDAGFDVILCPWDQGEDELHSCIQTVKNHNLFGLMHTTWNTLSVGMPYVAKAAVECFEDSIPFDFARTECAAKLRKVYFADGDYRRSGWSKSQVGDEIS